MAFAIKIMTAKHRAINSVRSDLRVIVLLGGHVTRAANGGAGAGNLLGDCTSLPGATKLLHEICSFIISAGRACRPGAGRSDGHHGGPGQLLCGLIPAGRRCLGRARRGPLRCRSAGSAPQAAGGTGRAPRLQPLQLPVQGRGVRSLVEPGARGRRQRGASGGVPPPPPPPPPLCAPPGARGGGSSGRQLIEKNSPVKVPSPKTMLRMRAAETSPPSIPATRLPTGSMRAPLGRSVAPTPNIRRWNWRKSFCSTCTSPGTAGTRWLGCSTSRKGRLRSGSRTAE